MHLNYRHEHHQQAVFNKHDQDIKLTKQTDSVAEINFNREKLVYDQNPLSQPMVDEYGEELKMSIKGTNPTDTITVQNQDASQGSRSARPAELNQTFAFTTSINVKNLLSYQDVMSAIEREFHLHDGQEREIIMKLWLKGQTMISILQRFRHLLQDLNADDKDFVEGMKQIREMINYSNRDVHYLREKVVMLENQNHFLENEFQRQLAKVIEDKNEQINRLVQTVDEMRSSSDQVKTLVNVQNQPLETEALSSKLFQQQAESQRAIERFLEKLDHMITSVNQKLDQQQTTTVPSSFSLMQAALEQMQESEMKLLELKMKSIAQQDENDLLRYLMEKAQSISEADHIQLLTILEQRALVREIELVRQELETTENKAMQLEEKLENADGLLKFHLENLRLKCDVLRKHIINCSQRLERFDTQNLLPLKVETRPFKNHERLDAEDNNDQLEQELTILRERYNELVVHANTLQAELEKTQKKLHEREKLESNLNNDLEREGRRADQIENEFKTLKIKYDDVCERISAAKNQYEQVQYILEQTTRRCEQLEKEKSEINVQSEHLSQNVAHVTVKYKEKLSSFKARLELADRDKHDLQMRNEQIQIEVERLKDELTRKKEIIFEKEKLLQDTQYKNREILLQRQSIEERISNEYKRLNDLVIKNNHLEEELDRMRRNQLSENIIIRQIEATSDSTRLIEELKVKLEEFERRYMDERSSKESMQVQMKILEEENADLREIMNQMRKRSQPCRKEDKDRNDEIQHLIARAEVNARQYMTNLNLTSLTTQSTLVKLVPISPSTIVS